MIHAGRLSLKLKDYINIEDLFNMQDEHFTFTRIAIIHSCYKEKFGIPRQPGLVASEARIEMDSEYSQNEAFRELESFSHIWVTFVFHGLKHSKEKKWQASVRPPRLGGNNRVGVFASRSMFRPNPIGLSVVELKSIERKNNKMILNIIGGDFLDKTPVIDIKPYIPYSDSIATAKAGFAQEKPGQNLKIIFSEQAINQIESHLAHYPHLKGLITEILQLDPRPAYQKEKPNRNEFAMKLYEFDLLWRMEGEQVTVTSLFVISNE